MRTVGDYIYIHDCAIVFLVVTFIIPLLHGPSHRSSFGHGHIIQQSLKENSSVIIVEGTTSKETREFSYKEDNIYRPVNKRGNGQFTNDR